MATIAFLGTGLLGAALAEAAAKRGDSVTVWNRSKDKADALKAFGIVVAATPAEAVKSATVSYTHLDVYKRQVKSIICLKAKVAEHTLFLLNKWR